MKSKIHEYQNKYLAMSKISKIIFAIAIASTFIVSSCRDTKTENDHGHEHNADGTHMNDEKVEQEEFQVGKDSMEMKTEEHGHDHDANGIHSDDADSDTHKHDKGDEHHDH